MKENISDFVKMVLFSCLLCIWSSGCARTEIPQVSYNELTKSIPLQVPANFIVKVTGRTVHTLNGQDIPVGMILKDSIEENLKKIDKFSVSDGSATASLATQYILGVNIAAYDPQFLTKDVALNKAKVKLKEAFGLLTMMEEANASNIVCDVSLYTVKNDRKGEQIIGDKLLFFTESFVAGEQLDKYNIENFGKAAMEYLTPKAVMALRIAAEGVDVAATLGAEEAIVKGCGVKISNVLEKEFIGTKE